MSDNQEVNSSDENIVNIANILSSMASEIDNVELNNMVVYPEKADTIKFMSQEDITELIDKSHKFMTQTMTTASTARGLLNDIYTKQGEIIQRASSLMLTGASDYFNSLKDSAKITASVIRNSALVGTTTLYDKVLKGIALVDKAAQSTGLRKSDDELIKEHEMLIYILLQKSSLRIMKGDDYIARDTSDADIKSIIKQIIATEDMTIIKSHIIRAAQIFFFNKMGKSVVENMSNITSKMEDMNNDSDRDLSDDNIDVVDQYNLSQLRQRILELTNNPDEFNAFLFSVIQDVHSDDLHNHSKYFGVPQDASVFIRDVIGPDGFLSIDSEYRLTSLEKNVEYYMNNIIGKKLKKDGTLSDGSSITPPNGILYKRVVSLQQQINESFDDILDYLKQQYKRGFSDFGNNDNEVDNISRLDNLRNAISSRKEVINSKIQKLLDTMNNAINNLSLNTNLGKRKARYDDADNDDSGEDNTQSTSRQRNFGGSNSRSHKKQTKKNKNMRKKSRITKKMNTLRRKGSVSGTKKKYTKKRPRRSTKKRVNMAKNKPIPRGK